MSGVSALLGVGCRVQGLWFGVRCLDVSTKGLRFRGARALCLLVVVVGGGSGTGPLPSKNGKFEAILPESQDYILVLTVSYVPTGSTAVEGCSPPRDQGPASSSLLLSSLELSDTQVCEP